MTDDDIAKANEIRKNARAYLAQLAYKPSSRVKTLDLYGRTAHRLIAAYNAVPAPRPTFTDWLPLYAGSKNSFYAYRAAVIFNEWRKAQKALAKMDEAHQKQDRRGFCDAAATLSKAQFQLARLSPDQGKKQIKAVLAGSSSAKKSPYDVAHAGEPKKRLKSKRSTLSKAPVDWREKLFGAMVAGDSQHTAAVAVLSLVGCRPAELATGVQVERYKDPLSDRLGLKLTITNAKFAKGTRVLLSLDDTRPEFHRLAKLAASGPVIISEPVPRRLSDAVRHYSNQVWPRVRWTLSPYSFRHAFAADFKASVTKRHNAGASAVNTVQVAAAMGHGSTVSQTAYGTRHQAKSTREIRVISAEIAIPDKDHTMTRNFEKLDKTRAPAQKKNLGIEW